MSPSERSTAPRYGRYVGLLALLILALITINTIVTKPNGVKGLAPGEQMPPFAVPLALGSLKGDADTARHADEGAAGSVAACQERGSQILNVCQLYEGAPVLLALFVDGGSCPDVLGDIQALAPSFPGVRIAAVAIKGNRASVRKLIRARGLRLPVGLDSDGALAALYKVATCPQLTFAYPGGEVQSQAILSRPSRATLRTRLSELVAAARARGWKGPGR
jgi:AhpC/TSA family